MVGDAEPTVEDTPARHLSTSISSACVRFARRAGDTGSPWTRPQVRPTFAVRGVPQTVADADARPALCVTRLLFGSAPEGEVQQAGAAQEVVEGQPVVEGLAAP